MTHYFYRPIDSVQAMTFDLDDTLYDNRPVIFHLESELQHWLFAHYPQTKQLSPIHWRYIKQKLAIKDPSLKHDVTKWRYLQLLTAMKMLGLSARDAKLATESAMKKVVQWRHQVKVPIQTHEILTLLCRRMPLVAITNGNLDPEKIGLGKYFKSVLQAGLDGDAKPSRQMFEQAANDLNIKPRHILHVGDHLVSDVFGAKQAGFLACWLNNTKQNIYQESVRIFPDLEIQSLSDLSVFIES